MEAISILGNCSFYFKLLTSMVMFMCGEGEAAAPRNVDFIQQQEAIVTMAALDSEDSIETAVTTTSVQKQDEQKEEASEEDTEETEAQLCSESEVYTFDEGFDSSFKAYMDYRTITDTASAQYEIQQEAYTDERGFRRIGDDYCVALGTGITDGCGERFLITLDSGCSFSVIVSDVKADVHTDSTCMYVPLGGGRGNVVEFIIDSSAADSAMLSSGNAGYYDDLHGNIKSIDKI